MAHSIPELADQLADYINLLVTLTQRLDEAVHSKFEKMSLKMAEFIFEYQAHFTLSVSEYASFLNHDALSPLTVVLGYAELFRSINAHLLTHDELDLLAQICDMARLLTDTLRNERDIMVARRAELSRI